jgi:signal transduction histidine kinase
LFGGSLATELRARVAMLDLLTARLEHAQEDERARLAAEVHDEPLQLALQLQRQIATEGAGRVATARSLALGELIVDRLRAVCLEVRPAALSELGLAAALELLAADLSQRAGMTITLDADPAIRELSLSPETELMLYRAAQEAMNNAIKHACASRLDVVFRRQAGEVELCVRDDGIGFDMPFSPSGLVAASHLGLAGLRQRAERTGWRLEVASSRGHGTCVRVRLPAIGRIA